MSLSAERFLKTYRSLESEDLLRLIASRPLVEEAQDAARLVLFERGVVGDTFERQYADALKSFARSSGVTNQCDFCGRNVVVGALHDEGQRFCDRECRDEARLLEASIELAPDLIADHAMSMFMGACPCCGRQGKPIEMWPRWLVVSAIWLFDQKVERTLSCRRCAQRKNWWAIVGCMTLGWWSLPGLFGTPRAIYLNLREIYGKRVITRPSASLVYRARLDLAKQLTGPMSQIAGSNFG